jgi:hypothetical protein
MTGEPFDDLRTQVVVEWEVGDPAGDEELADLSHPHWLDTPRRRRVAAALAAALLATLVGVRLAASDRPTQRAAGQAGPTAVATAIGSNPVNVTPGFRRRDPSHCPEIVSCRTVTTMPPGVLAAIRRYAPRAVSGNAFTVLQVDPDGVYFRQVNARAGQADILVRVAHTSRQDAQSSQGIEKAPDETIGYARAVTADGFDVQVQFTGPPGYAPPLTAIRALAADRRLRAVG